MANSEQIDELYQDVRAIRNFLIGDEYHEGFQHQFKEVRKMQYTQNSRLRDLESHTKSCNLIALDKRVKEIEDKQKQQRTRNNAIMATLASIAGGIWQWERIVNFFRG